MSAESFLTGNRSKSRSSCTANISTQTWIPAERTLTISNTMQASVLSVGTPPCPMLTRGLDHCLDFIRQGILCHLDYSLYTVYWGERRQDIPTHRDPPVQKCVNWDKLKAWMAERAANTDDLVRP
jgi:hypothetical protein